MCKVHPGERIKYFCRDDGVGTCPECIVHHAKHDFVLADEGASFEVRHHLKTLSINMQCKINEY